jgi:hypothetical protein
MDLKNGEFQRSTDDEIIAIEQHTVNVPGEPLNHK